MSTILAFDLGILMKYIWQQALTCLFIAFVMAVCTGFPGSIPAAIGVMVPLTLLFTLAALDEHANWEQFRLTMPVSRADVVVGRYATCLVIAVASVAAGLVLAGIVVGVACAVPGIPYLSDVLVDLAWEPVLVCAAAGLAIALVTIAVMLPLVVRFGMTKAVRYAPAVGVAIVLAALIGGGFDALGGIVDSLGFPVAASPGLIAAFAAAAIAVVAALYAASCALSCRLYATREL